MRIETLSTESGNESSWLFTLIPLFNGIHLLIYSSERSVSRAVIITNARN